MSVPVSIEQFLVDHLGLEEAATGKGTISRAIRAVMKRGEIQDVLAYERLFASSAYERQKLIDEIVVGETWFFRDKGPFDCLALQAQELRNVLAQGDALKILSAPCSSGEEPYSIVMTLLKAGLSPAAFSVDAADISTRSLEAARKAHYGRNAFREPLEKNYAPYFLETERGKQVTDPVCRQVRFIQDNLAAPRCLDGYGPYHVIFCRNFLIYLTSEARHRVFKSLDRLLVPGGFLFSGHAETVFWQMNGYRPLRQERAFAFSKPHPSPSPVTGHSQRQEKPPMDRHGQKRLTYPPRNGVATNTALETSAKQLPRPGEEIATPPKGRQAVTRKSEIHRSSLDPQLREARRLADRGSMDEAVRLCQEYEKTAGPVAETYCLMGLIHEAGNDIRCAEEYFLKALYLDPCHYESLVHTSLLCKRRGDERKASLYRERAERSKKEIRGRQPGD